MSSTDVEKNQKMLAEGFVMGVAATIRESFCPNLLKIEAAQEHFLNLLRDEKNAIHLPAVADEVRDILTK